jgi:hypothetical protein
MAIITIPNEIQYTINKEKQMSFLLFKQTCAQHPNCISYHKPNTDTTCRYLKNNGCLLSDPPCVWESWMSLQENEIICINDSCWVGNISQQGHSRKLDITIGKTYQTTISGRHYELTDDKNNTNLFPKHCFLNFKGESLLE